MKVLFIGDYSNLHATLASELKKRGHQVAVMSDGGNFMKTDTDIYLERTSGIKGAFGYLFKLFSLLPELKGYDVVQLINPNFLSLKPGKIKYFFDKIRAQNGSVFLSLAGNDYYFVKACNDAKTFRFSQFKIGNDLTEFSKQNPSAFYSWLSDGMRRWTEYLYSNINGAMSVLPEYDMAARPILGDRLCFTNLPLDLSNLPFSPLDIDGKFKIFVGIKKGREVEKGTDILLSVAKDLEREMPERVEVETVRNLSLQEYLERMKQSHIVLDQLYSYSPAYNALQAMALGRIAGTGGQPEFYDYIGNQTERPILNLSPFEDTGAQLRQLILNPDNLTEMSRQGRKMVEENNEVFLVTDKFISHWEKLQ